MPSDAIMEKRLDRLEGRLAGCEEALLECVDLVKQLDLVKKLAFTPEARVALSIVPEEADDA
jgi:hypothetical protein